MCPWWASLVKLQMQQTPCFGHRSEGNDWLTGKAAENSHILWGKKHGFLTFEPVH